MEDIIALLKTAEAQLNATERLLDSVDMNAACEPLKQIPALNARYNALETRVRKNKQILLEALATTCCELFPLDRIYHAEHGYRYQITKDLTIVDMDSFRRRGNAEEMSQAWFDRLFWRLVDSLITAIQHNLKSRSKTLENNERPLPEMLIRLQNLPLTREIA